MPPSRAGEWQRASALLDAALDLPPNERASLLDGACAGDPALRARVEELLAACEEVGSALELPAAQLAAGLVGAAEAAAPDALVGRRIGPYRLVRALGEGGMGAVYLAERADDTYRKQVAVKLIRHGLASAEVRERFRNERQILATLEHPNIARLLDGGVTDGALGAGLASLPYLVMEYVDGEPLDRFCDRKVLSIPDRLRLFGSVCAAVGYAHQHHVVHRDLKPSNILVADRRESTGPAATVKLLDFGIAKLVDEGAGPDAAGPRTRTGVHLMTPEYASPEQVRGERVTPASDVYALGVLLYELLTGRRPYGLGTRSPTDLQRAVLETEPERPSAVVGRAGADAAAPGADPFAASNRRGLTIDRHRRLLRGDLDAITLKALRKEPGRRYASAEALRADLERHLEGKPVSAHTGALAYRATKLARRHRAWITAAAFVALTSGLATAYAAGALPWSRRPAVPAAGAGAGPPAALLAERRVAVAPLDNQTGDSALAPLGRLASDWMTQGLAEAGFAEVVDPQTARAAWQSAANPRALGVATGARYVVSGAYDVDGDSLRLLARITDAADGKLLRAVEPVTVSAARPREAVAAVRERVVGAVGGLIDRRLAGVNTIASAGLPPSLTAYRHWSAGMEHFNRTDFRAAIPELVAAARLDSTFIGPLLYAAVAHSAIGEPAAADSLFRIANRSRARLAPADRYLLDAWRAENRGDWTGALAAIREASRLAPGNVTTLPVTWWNALRTNRPREAMAALARLDPERPPVRDYPPYWDVLTRAHHQLADYPAELAAAGRGRRLHPNHAPVIVAEARALAALGRTADAERRLAEVLELAPDPLYVPGELTWALGRELRAHGREADALAAFGRALAWYDARPAAERASPAMRGRRAEALYAAGRWDEARQHFAALAAERRGDGHRVGDLGTLGISPLGELDYRGYLGALAARRGDRAAALTADRVLAAWPGAYLLGRHTLWRARIAALLGDRERAMGLLREALQQGRTHLVVHAEADFAALHDLPAFQELLRPKG